MMGREVGLIDGKTAQTVYRAVLANHRHGEQNRLLHGAGQGDQCSGATAALNGGNGFAQMLRKAGKIR